MIPSTPMKTFGSVNVPQNKGFERAPRYFEQCAHFQRRNFTTHPGQHHLTLLTGVIPVMRSTVETSAGKSWPIASSAWNWQTEEFDGVDPFRDYNGTDGSFEAYCLVLVHEWLNDPSLNPEPSRGPIAVLAMTKGIYDGIVGVSTAWNLENISAPENWSKICLTVSASRKGGENSPLTYTVQGVPSQFAITEDYVSTMLQNKQAFWWDLQKYVESQKWAAGEQLSFLARNDYYSQDEIYQYAQKFLQDPERYYFCATEAEKPQRPEGVEEYEWIEWQSWEKVKERVDKAFTVDTSQAVPQGNGLARSNQMPAAPAPAAPAPMPGMPAQMPGAPAPTAPAPTAPAPTAPAGELPAGGAPAAAPVPVPTAPAPVAAAPAAPIPGAPAAPSIPDAPVAPPAAPSV